MMQARRFGVTLAAAWLAVTPALANSYNNPNSSVSPGIVIEDGAGDPNSPAHPLYTSGGVDVSSAPVAPGAASATYSMLVGCIYNASGVTFANGNQGAAQCDSLGRFIINVGNSALPTGAATAANQTADQAPVAPATATATKSVLFGGQYNSTQPTFTNGQQGSAQFTGRGGLIVAPGADGFAISGTQLGSPGDTSCGSDTGSCALNALLQRVNVHQTQIIAALGTPYQAGGSLPLPTGAATGANQTSSLGPAAPGSAAANSRLTGCIYNSTLPTPTNGQQLAVQCDQLGGTMPYGSRRLFLTGSINNAQATYTEPGATSPIGVGGVQTLATGLPAGTFVTGTITVKWLSSQFTSSGAIWCNFFKGAPTGADFADNTAFAMSSGDLALWVSASNVTPTSDGPAGPATGVEAMNANYSFTGIPVDGSGNIYFALGVNSTAVWTTTNILKYHAVVTY